MDARKVFVILQAATFLPLAVLLFQAGEYRLAAAQLLLGFITGLLYF